MLLSPWYIPVYTNGGDRYIKNLLGVDHAGIGSDLRGMRSYNEGFGDEANFNAVAEALADAGYSDEDIAKVMGGTTSMGRSDATTEPAAAPAPSSTSVAADAPPR